MLAREWILCPGCGGFYHRDDLRPCGTCLCVEFVIVRGRIELRDGQTRLDCRAICPGCLSPRRGEIVIGTFDQLTGRIWLHSKRRAAG